MLTRFRMKQESPYFNGGSVKGMQVRAADADPMDLEEGLAGRGIAGRVRPDLFKASGLL